jgi:hypothetical protein
MEPQVEQWVAWGNIHLIDLTSFWTILILYYLFSHVLLTKSLRRPPQKLRSLDVRPVFIVK